MFCLQRKKNSLPKTDFLEPSHTYFVSCFWEAWIWSWLIVLICGTRRLSRSSPRLHSERSTPTTPLLRSSVAWSLIPSDLWRKNFIIDSLKEKKKFEQNGILWNLLSHTWRQWHIQWWTFCRRMCWRSQSRESSSLPDHIQDTWVCSMSQDNSDSGELSTERRLKKNIWIFY